MTLLLDEASAEADAPAPVSDRSDSPLLLAAVLSLGAAVVHIGFAPTHFDEKWSHGMFFLVVGGLQAAWAVLALGRFRWARPLALLNLGVVFVWALSRSVGVDGYDAEPIGYPDALATGLELGVVWAAALRVSLRRGFVAALGVVVGAAALFSLTPRFADAHSHDEAADVAADVAADHVAEGAPKQVVRVGSPCEQSGAPLSPAQITDGHSHRGPVDQKPINQRTRQALAAQQEQARTVVDRFPTVAAATAGGYRMSTTFVPCIGAHYTNLGLVARFDPAAPSELLFDGTRPDSKLVGLSYLVYHPGGAPEGFAGPNDVWHQHNANGGLCFNRSGVVIGAEDSTPEQCRALGGVKRELTDVWMLHDWVVPGWECTWGVFAPECPELGGKLGLSAWD